MKKLPFIILLLLLTTDCFGATQLLRTVKPSGGDYTSLEACMNANEQDLVAADRYFDVEIDGSWTSADTTAVTVHLYTTDATRYINIYTTSAARHNGTAASGYQLYNGGADGTNALLLSTNYVTITGLIIKGRNGLYLGRSFRNTAVTGCLINKCVIPTIIDTGNVTDGGSLEFRNSIFYNYTVQGHYNTHTLTVRNCTFINDLVRLYGTINATNVFANSFSSISSMTTCASVNATGSAGLQNIAYSTANFTNVTEGSENLHLVAGSALIDVGTDLSATFTDDIDGVTRVAPWDIGADEYVTTFGAKLYQGSVTLLGSITQ